MKRPQILLPLFVLLPVLTFGQSEGDLIGTWKVDKAYILRHNDFELFEVEKHPYDTIHLDNDHSFYIRCHQLKTNRYPNEEHWTIRGQWTLKKNALHFTARISSDGDEKLPDVRNKVMLKDNNLYINYGKAPGSKRIYVRYIKLT